MFARFQIVRVLSVGVCLFFETKTHVSFVETPVTQELYDKTPKSKVRKIK